MTRKLPLFALSLAASLLAGCGAGNLKNAVTGTAPGASVVLHGKAYGGQQPIYNALIQLYQAGTTGYGTGAAALISGGVYTDINGNFSIDNDYTCTPGSMVYITATGGQPTTGVTNSSSNLIAGLGNCSNLSTSTNILLDEVTTVGTVWALSPFMSGLDIGAPSTNQAGLVNAFADVNTLVNTVSGSAQASTATVTVPSAEINTIADIIAACINSSGTTGECTTLFNNAPNANSTIPTDTVTAAINIARNPARNVSNLFVDQSSSPPFEPTLTAISDFTLAVTYTGSGISAPKAVAIDASNNVWIANASSVTELSHTGVPAGSSPFTGNGISAPTAIAIDTSGDAWIANSNSTITELSSTGGNVGSSPFSGGGLNIPSSIAFDGLGNAWLANSGANVVSEFSSTGSPISGASGFSTGAPTIGIAIDPQ